MVAPALAAAVLTRAIFLKSTHVIRDSNHSSYSDRAIGGIEALQGWYDNVTGLWDTTGWWNAANCVTVLADFASLKGNDTGGIDIVGVIERTFRQAQTTPTQKTISADGLVRSTYLRSRIDRPSGIGKRGFRNFLNDFYDDEGWWALALIRSHDMGMTGSGYLQDAADILEDMKKGRSSCGGIYWGKKSNYTNAIANELYLCVAASLANRLPSKKDYYVDIARKQWDWFKNSGLINRDNLINDGLTDKCENNGNKAWSYNQGVILGGLVELHRATTDDASLLQQAHSTASAAMGSLSRNGTLFDGCEPNCGDDGDQFKGIFIRHLAYLHRHSPREPYRRFVLDNADAIWAHDRRHHLLGPAWPGPYEDATAATQSSALDALVAAVAVF